MVGEPTGLTAKTWVSERSAFDLGVGWSFDGETSLHVHASYLWHFYDLVAIEEGKLPFYIGLGVRYKQVDSRVIRTTVVTTETPATENGEGEDAGENGETNGEGAGNQTTTTVERVEDGRDRVGVRIPIGVAYHFPRHRMEVFGEVAPIIDITPTSKLSINAAVGIRFYF